jgi:2-keto-3-deoxy-L-rhamnonate aldolase RhmA
MGVIVPHIRSVQDAKDVVAAAKFQPLGHRSSTNNMPQFQYRHLSAKAMSPVCNRETLVIPMVETLEAVDCVEELAAVEGVDSLLIGTNDMCAELGIPGEYENPRLTEVYEKTIAACKKHGKWVGVGGLHSRLDLVEKFCAMGARWVMAATDGPLLLGGATKRAGEMAQLSARVKEAGKAEVPKNNGAVNGSGGGAIDALKQKASVAVEELMVNGHTNEVTSS